MTPGAPAPDGPIPDEPPPAPGSDPTPATPPETAHGTRGVARATVDIAAPPERVFRALTDPAELAEWWGPDAPGDAARVVDPPHTVEYTWRARWDDAVPGTVRYELAPAEVDGLPGTRVTVTHTGPQMRARPAWLARRRVPAWAARTATA